jgi:antirestriction protein ArdC
MKADLYQRITDSIVTKLEQGVRPWMQPWAAGFDGARIIRPLRHNGQPYNGINVLVLWSEAQDKGYASPYWMTFKQTLEFEAHVRKGEHGSLVVYADKIIRNEADAGSGEACPGPRAGEEVRAIPFLKSYTVFNVEQIVGLPERFYGRPEPKAEPVARIERADAFFAATGASIVHGGCRACYVPRTDNIHMPYIDCFRDAESYYATLAHEATHWTRHETRLNRDFGRNRWGDEGYAMEELVAELGAAFLAADLDLTPEVRDDHAAYIASWIKVLRIDKRAIFSAASHAQRAADFLHGAGREPTAASNEPAEAA